jgi:hypothetical protein
VADDRRMGACPSAWFSCPCRWICTLGQAGEHPLALDLPRPGGSASDQSVGRAVHVPEQFVNCVRELNRISGLLDIHCAEDGLLDCLVVVWLKVIPLKTVAPQDMTAPDDEVAPAATVPPDRGKERQPTAAQVEAPRLTRARRGSRQASRRSRRDMPSRLPGACPGGPATRHPAG